MHVVTVLGSPGSVDEICHNSSSECEEVGLLQQVGWHAAVSQHGSKGQCGMEVKVYPYIQPDLWGTAYDGWEKCAGKQQSPINIVCTQGKPKYGPKLKTSYSALPSNSVANNGHALNVDGNFGSLQLGSLTYDVQGFHVHTPSENTVDGKHADMELHIVHKSQTGKLAVVAIFLNIGKPNKCLEKMLSAPAPLAGCDKPIGKMDLSCFQKQLSGPWWSFDGSLTTPPCTEGLKWNVMKKRGTISKEQLEAFKERYQMNARPTQPLHGRKVTYNKIR